ncbi:MAG TPA: hypothetical protein VM238_22860 [Phycisphaerae bacterium]|nr:hypothetical protein [Phycisphaerae bacterium]
MNRNRIMTGFGIALAVLLAGCGSGSMDRWSLGASFTDALAEGSLLYAADPNGRAGPWLLYADDGGDEEVLGAGLRAEFAMGPIYEAAFNLVLPGQWDLDKAPAKPWGRLGAGWNARDDRWIGMVGTGVKFFPGRAVQPVLWTDVYSGAGVSGVQVSMGFVWAFGPEGGAP